MMYMMMNAVEKTECELEIRGVILNENLIFKSM